MLLSAYRKDDLADAEGFVAQLGVVLEGYEADVIIAVTEPRTGIQRRLKFMPTIAEVVEACDAEAQARATRARYEAMPKPRPVQYRIPDRLDGRHANLFIPADNPQYQQAAEWVKTADPADWKYDPEGRNGIWICYGWWDSNRTVGPGGKFKTMKRG